MKPLQKYFIVILCALTSLFGLSANAQQTATAAATLFNGFVVGVTITDGGNGYTFAPTVSFSGGGGSGAMAYSTISNGIVTAITVTNAGSGYSSAPQVLLTAPSSTPFASSLVLDLPLDDSVTDVGPYDFTVTDNGGGTFMPDRDAHANSALALNGANQNLSIPYDARLYPDEFTLSAWVNFQQLSGTIVQAGNGSTDSWRGFGLLFDGFNLVFHDYTGIGYNEQLYFPITNFTAGTWSQIVITRTTNSCSMFFNGVKVASATGLTPYTKPQVTPLSLGCGNADPNGFNQFCAVTFDTIHLYNRALSDDEVQTLYTNEIAGLVPMVGMVVKTIRVNMTQLVSGQNYQLETTTNLTSWNAVSDPFNATNSTSFQDIDILGTGMGYFRVVELP